MAFPTIVYILFGVYVAAVNVYGIIILKIQKNARELGLDKGVSDLRIFLTAFLGGALGLFVSVLAMKYRLKNMLLMIGLPLIVAFNVYCIILLIGLGANPSSPVPYYR